MSRLYRRWAFESAALDLALRQRGTHARACARARAAAGHVRRVTATRETRDDGAGRKRRLDRYPALRFKLDPTPEWTDDLIAQLVDTGAVDSVDFKGFYQGTVVDNPPDPDLYRRGGRRRFRTHGSRTPG